VAEIRPELQARFGDDPDALELQLPTEEST